MAYPVINSRRIAYDIDGTMLGYRLDTNTANGISTWANSTLLGQLNNGTSGSISSGYGMILWLFFPEKRIINAMTILATLHNLYPISIGSLEGSNDTTNGIDGTWESATTPNGTSLVSYTNESLWRTYIKEVNFTQAYRVIRIRFTMSSYNNWVNYIKSIYIYGSKATGERPNDIIFCSDNTGTEITALKDWGDRQEGTTQTDTFYLKDTSTTKTANTITIATENLADITLSLDNATWSSSINLTSLGSGAISQPIYIKNTIGAPPQTLGARAGRVKVTIGSWT